MSQTVILGTARTPFGKMGGALSSLDATDLGRKAIECALERSEVEPDQVQSVIYGQVLQAGQGQIPSRQAQIKAGIPREVPSETVNKVCASGMRTIGLADQAIRAGDLELAVTGGMESMSQAPYLLPGARFGFRMGDVNAIDSMTHDGLTNPFTGKQMIDEASEVSNELEITRPDMDRFAARSHQLAAKATDEGRLADKIDKAPEDVDLWEINEAFASVAINSIRMLGIEDDRVNVNGGAIALGHPIGASGARIVGALVHELRSRGGGLGCAAICSGGGQGDAIVIEV